MKGCYLANHQDMHVLVSFICSESVLVLVQASKTKKILMHFPPKPKNEGSQQPTWKKQVSFKQETITILPINILIFTIAKN